MTASQGETTAVPYNDDIVRKFTVATVFWGLKSSRGVVNMTLLCCREPLWIMAWEQEERGQHAEDMTTSERFYLPCGSHMRRA
jgi:hypothetical protein